MPRHPRLQSLHEICMNSVIENMENFWCQQFLKEMNQTHWLFVEGPFDTIQPQMCDTIINRLHNKRLLKRHHIYLLINPGLKSLSLEKSAEANTDLVLQLLSVRCKKLKSLVLNQSKFKGEFFQDVCRKASEHLTELKLSKTQIGNSEIAIIGSTCSNLKHLDISDLANVTDKGLQTLHQKVNLQGKFDDQFGKCTKLVSLDITGTFATVQSAVSILESLRETLIDFEYPFSFIAALEYLSGSDSGQLKIRKLDLDLHSYMNEDDRPPISSAVEFVSQFCPFVQRLVVKYSDASVTCDDLSSLLREPRIVKEVFFLCEDESLATYSRFGFENVIFNQGRNLRDVTLVGIGGISLTDLLNNCPLVENLHLDYNVYLLSSEEVISNEPCLIKQLRLHCLPSSEMVPTSPSSFELGRLLNRAKTRLTSLDISGCDQLNDSVFFDVSSNLGTGSSSDSFFPNLQKIRLVDCNFVSWTSLSMFTHSSNDLQDLFLDRCRNIHRSHIDGFKKYLSKNKLSVNVSWS